jgi:hypothetical protein
VAELWSVYEGLCLARRQNFNNIKLQVDSLVVVRGIKGEEVGSARGRILLNRIRWPMNMDWNVRISHIYREANKVADAIASLGCSIQGLSYFDTPPAGSVYRERAKQVLYPCESKIQWLDKFNGWDSCVCNCNVLYRRQHVLTNLFTLFKKWIC